MGRVDSGDWGPICTKAFLAAFLSRRVSRKIIIDPCGKQIQKVGKIMVKRFMKSAKSMFPVMLGEI